MDPPHLMKLGAPEVLPDALEDAAGDVDVVEDGEADEEPRERVVHLLGEEHRDDHAVGHEPEGAWERKSEKQICVSPVRNNKMDG